MFNFNGDKRPTSIGGPGFNVSGWLRVLIEFTFGSVGIWGAWLIFGPLGVTMQSFLVMFSFILDRKRWLWMLGRQEDAPYYVTILHKKIDVV
jgi:hypothetical protein